MATDEEASLVMETEFVLMKKVEMNSCNKVDSSVERKDSKLFVIDVGEIAVHYE